MTCLGTYNQNETRHNFHLKLPILALQTFLYHTLKHFVGVIIKQKLENTVFPWFVNISIYICTLLVKIVYSLSGYDQMDI